MELEEKRERNKFSRRLFADVLEANVTENRMLCSEGSRWMEIIGLMASTSFEDMIKAYVEHFIHPDYVEELLECYDIWRLTASY